MKFRKHLPSILFITRNSRFKVRVSVDLKFKMKISAYLKLKLLLNMCLNLKLLLVTCEFEIRIYLLNQN